MSADISLAALKYFFFTFSVPKPALAEELIDMRFPNLSDYV